MVGGRNRDISRRKAERKRDIARKIYRSWNGGEDWEYYDNLHQFSKNKIHCSCPYCSAKTRNKGRRDRGNYRRAINYKKSDLLKQIDMDIQMEELTGNNFKRKFKNW